MNKELSIISENGIVTAAGLVEIHFSYIPEHLRELLQGQVNKSLYDAAANCDLIDRNGWLTIEVCAFVPGLLTDSDLSKRCYSYLMYLLAQVGYEVKSPKYYEKQRSDGVEFWAKVSRLIWDARK